jgi:hypothetical protein
MKKKSLLTPAAVPGTTPPIAPELATEAHAGTPHYGDYGHPSANPAPAAPDHRTDGGDVYDLSREQTEL